MADSVKIKILFVLDYYYPHIGGGEVIFQRLAEGLVNRGNTVKVITSNNNKSLPQKEIINGVDIERISTPKSGARFFFPILSTRSVLIAARQADVIHTTAFGGALIAFLGARMADRPILFTILEVLGDRWRKVEHNPIKAFFYRLLEWIIIKLPYDYWVAISDATLKDAYAIRIPKIKSSRIYPGADYELTSPVGRTGTLRKKIGAQDNDFIYLYFGRPGITKGVNYLLQAASEIQSEIPESRLVLLLSDQPQKQYMELCKEAQELSPFARINILPSIKDKKDLYNYLRDADCIVIPSVTEGFGLSAAETCSLGIPIVATRTGSLPEVVSGCYLMIEPASSQAITKAVIQMYYKDWSETPLKKFSWVVMVMDYETIYLKLI
jgi:glycosyltransferase involved in cell wall biosynthesis